jgi:excisionase family DNA binding protein
MDNDKSVYTPKEVAEKLGVSLSFVYRKLKDKSIPGIHLGDRWLIPISSFSKWLEKNGYRSNSKELDRMKLVNE